jgi:hypothetical protein
MAPTSAPLTRTSLHIVQGHDPSGIEDKLDVCTQRKTTAQQRTNF